MPSQVATTNPVGGTANAAVESAKADMHSGSRTKRTRAETIEETGLKSTETKDFVVNFALERGDVPTILADTDQRTAQDTKHGKKRLSRAKKSQHAAFLRHSSSPNKYGIQPMGNMFMLPPGETSINKSGLGALDRIGEAKLIEVLQLLGPETVAQMSQLSKAMWMYCTQEDLWKNFVCARLARDYPQGVPHGFFEGYHGWRQLYYDKFTSWEGPDDLLTVESNRFYSDVLYMGHQCSTTPLEDLCSTGTCTIDRVDGISVADFITHYERPNLPVVLKASVSKGFPCMSKWTFDYFKKRHGDRYFQAECLTLAFRDYFDYANGIPQDIGEESSLYLFDRHFTKDASGLDSDYNVPGYFSEDLFQYIGPQRPDFRWVIMGPKRSGSTFHIDPNGTSAWNLAVVGRKKWVMYPPGVTPPGVYPTADRSEVTSPVSVPEWFLQHYTPGEAYECVVEPGEIMFVPRGWWHTVINLDDSIAITQNYVSTQGLRHVMDFISDDSLVSGYPGNGVNCSANGLEDEATLTRKQREQEQQEQNHSSQQCSSTSTDCESNAKGDYKTLREALRNALETHKPGLLEKVGVYDDEARQRLREEDARRRAEAPAASSLTAVGGDNGWSGFDFL